MTRALAHIGATSSFYTSRFRPIKFFGTIVKEEVLVLILKKRAIIYYSGIFFFLFYFAYTSACNLVFAFCV